MPGRTPKIMNSSPGMSTFLWGPLFWALMHDVAVITDKHWHSSSPAAREELLSFWSHLRDVLPCKWCRKSYRKFYSLDPPTYPVVNWVWALHNKVNTKLEKPLFELDKFKRKTHVYSSFSNVNMLWDIHFILALNYEPVKKKQGYRGWLKCISNLVPYLVHDCGYEASSVNAFVNKTDKSLFTTALTSKLTLLKWLGQHRDPAKSLDYFVIKYAPAIAHKNTEELLQLCGPLILKCRNK